MTTANATTNEQGYHLMGGASVGRPIKSSDLYAEKAQNSFTWKLKNTQELTFLKYSADRMVGIGAMRLLESYPDNSMSKCYIYQSVNTRHSAIHCPAVNRVVIINPRGGYVIRNDESFKGVR
jgi:hypothetical protein